MGASNWALCPHCMLERKKEQEEREAHLRQSYGVASVERYEQLRREVESARTRPIKTTLREDYRVGIDRYGLFSIEYKAFCDVCRFTFRWDHGGVNTLGGGSPSIAEINERMLKL